MWLFRLIRDFFVALWSYLVLGRSPPLQRFDTSKNEDFTVVIIGCGMSGMATAVRCKEAGIKFVILEEAPRLGGTWWHNTYPNCACDVAAHLYAFSFAPKSDWSRVYAYQPEILAYLEDVARQHDLYPHIRFNTAVRSATFDEATSVWLVGTSAGNEYVGNALVVSLGPLHTPSYPEIDGLDTFQGDAFHSARWQKDFDASGRRVAVIGNGASALQLVPPVAAKAERVYIFQRSPHWVTSTVNRRYWSVFKLLFRYCPPLRVAYRCFLYLTNEFIFMVVFSRDGLGQRLIQRLLRRFIRQTVADPAVAAAVTPSYPVGCKRILTCGEPYLRALNRPNVTLVTDRITRATPRGLETRQQGVVEVDTIIYATGFDVKGSTLTTVDVKGVGGKRLASSDWAASPKSYLGLSVSGFPNAFLLLGPNTGLGHNTVVYMAECQVNYAMQAIRYLVETGAKTVDVKSDVQDAWHSKVMGALKGSVWSACKSWYQTEKGELFALWPSFTFAYWWETLYFKPEDYVVK